MQTDRSLAHQFLHMNYLLFHGSAVSLRLRRRLLKRIRRRANRRELPIRVWLEAHR